MATSPPLSILLRKNSAQIQIMIQTSRSVEVVQWGRAGKTDCQRCIQMIKLHISNSTTSWYGKREPGFYLLFDTADGGTVCPHKYLRCPHERKKSPTYTEECPKLGNTDAGSALLSRSIPQVRVPKPPIILIYTLAVSLPPGLDDLSMVLLIWNELG